MLLEERGRWHCGGGGRLLVCSVGGGVMMLDSKERDSGIGRGK